MGSSVTLPTSKVGDVVIVDVPRFIFGNRILIQAHEIKRVIRGRDITDGHECDQTEARGDIKFFSRSITFTSMK